MRRTDCFLKLPCVIQSRESFPAIIAPRTLNVIGPQAFIQRSQNTHNIWRLSHPLLAARVPPPPTGQSQRTLKQALRPQIFRWMQSVIARCKALKILDLPNAVIMCSVPVIGSSVCFGNFRVLCIACISLSTKPPPPPRPRCPSKSKSIHGFKDVLYRKRLWGSIY
jgi:hypothetical protein